MNTTQKAFETVKRRAESLRNDEHRQVGTMSPGDAVAQGDVAVVFCGKKRPPNMQQVKRLTPPGPAFQVAEGNSPGSRHCVDITPDVKLFSSHESGNPLIGPTLHATAPWCLRHPDHGDRTFTEPGWYYFRYQRAAAEELRRIQD